MTNSTTKELPVTKAGYIAIIGEPNVGKSTLMNQILGTKLSIVTAKPQTTRKRILGIYSAGNVQMIFWDTPGIITPKYEMHRAMMEYVRESLSDADIIVVMLDASSKEISLDFLTGAFRAAVLESEKPVIVVLNKMDALHDPKIMLPIMKKIHDSKIARDVVPISAKKGSNVADLVATIEKYLPEHPLFYDPELLSELPQRFFVAELIRETVFKQFKKEIPYSTEIQVTQFKENIGEKWLIAADIIVERDSQKGIIIGAKGTKLREVGERSRLAIEHHLEGQPVYLELHVKVREDWRNDKNMLNSFGY